MLLHMFTSSFTLANSDLEVISQNQSSGLGDVYDSLALSPQSMTQ